MAQINPTLPVLGQPNSTEDPHTRSTLSAILAVLNGGIDSSNISPTANILDSQLASGGGGGGGGSGTVSKVTSLPTSGLVDGQTVDYVGLGSGVRWRLVYNNTTGKWDFVGGTPYIVQSTGQQAETLTSGSFQWQNALSSPTISLPFTGDYTVRWGAHVFVSQSAAQSGAQLDVAAYNGSVRSNAATVGVGIVSPPGSYSVQGQAVGEDRMNGISGTLRLQIAGTTTASGVYYTYYRRLAITPIQVS